MSTSPIPPTLTERTGRLNGLHERLRAHHFGIDKEIQQLLDAFAPWYRFAETQVRPRAIGLWGMTGTGKSSVVRALVKESGLEDRTYWLDAGECRDDHWLDKVFNRMDEHLSGAPFILVVDEFQHARTLRDGQELEEPTMLRRFWELLDSGRMVTWSRFSLYDAMNVVDFQASLHTALRAGVEVENGRVVTGADMFKQIMAEHYTISGDPPWAVPGDIWSSLRDLHFDPLPSLSDIERKLSGLDADGIFSWCEGLLRNTQRNRVVDASKMMVILLGNLDELYTTGKEPMAELDPDVLLHRHQDIGLAGVQNALLKLFRIEQVGRMGASHIVFPPIGRTTIDTIVRDEVTQLSERLATRCGRTIEVDNALVDHLRSTSAIAVLGARPVVQAVQNTVPLLLSQVLDQQDCEPADPIRFGVSDGIPVAVLGRGEQVRQVPLAWPAGMKQPDDTRDAWLERAAIHETGHLLCGVLLCGRKPLQVCARTRDPQVGGFVAWDRRPDRPLLRSEVVPELACMLGGWAAERIHFGTDGVSSGSAQDIRNATAFALNMAKEAGMGGDRLHHAHHHCHEGNGFRTVLPEAEAQARQWIDEAERLAIATLQGHTDLLEQCVERLQEKGSLGMVELERLTGSVKEADYLGTLNTVEA